MGNRHKPGYVPEQGKEGVQAACLQLLTVHHIRHFRMNAGDTIGIEADGHRWRKRGHGKGTGDVLMLIRHLETFTNDSGSITRCVAFITEPVWLEFKSTTGKQSEAQSDFQVEAEKNGETYLIIRDPNELDHWLRSKRVY